MSSTPYIGITGFDTVEQVGKVAQHIAGYPVGYMMFGFTSSNKRLLDPTSRGKTSPALGELNALVKAVPPGHLPMIHYFTSNPITLVEEVAALFKYCRLDARRCAIQLNLTLPDPIQIAKLQKHFNGALTITLQLPKDVLQENPTDLVAKLKRYNGMIQYMLIDPSGGQGLDFRTASAVELLVLMQKELPEVTPGVAGGFSADNVAARIREIGLLSQCSSCHQEKLHDYCIDAQGKLRHVQTINPVFPLDAPTKTISTLSVEKTTQYIDDALAAICEN